MQMVCSLMIINELLGTVYGQGGPVQSNIVTEKVYRKLRLYFVWIYDTNWQNILELKIT